MQENPSNLPSAVTETSGGTCSSAHSCVAALGQAQGLQPQTHLHFHTKPGWLSREPVDMFIPQPEVPTDAAKTLLILLPVAVEGDQATLAPLDEGPASTCCVHVTEHLEQKGCSGQRLTGMGSRCMRMAFATLCLVPTEQGDTHTSMVTLAYSAAAVLVARPQRQLVRLTKAGVSEFTA